MGSNNTGRSRRGRPTLEAAILDAIRSGCSIEAACQSAGVSRATFYRWRDQDEAFGDQVDKAIAESEVRLVRSIEAAGQSDWRASAWLLERRFSHWSKREAALPVQVAAPVEVIVRREDRYGTTSENRRDTE